MRENEIWKSKVNEYLKREERLILKRGDLVKIIELKNECIKIEKLEDCEIIHLIPIDRFPVFFKKVYKKAVK